MLRPFNKKGQGILEQALLWAAVGAAVVAITAYLSKGMQGNIQEKSDQLGPQYKYGETTGTITQQSHVESTESFQAGVTTNTIINQRETTTGNLAVAP